MVSGNLIQIFGQIDVAEDAVEGRIRPGRCAWPRDGVPPTRVDGIVLM
jgi:hypothetical protein